MFVTTILTLLLLISLYVLIHVQSKKTDKTKFDFVTDPVKTSVFAFDFCFFCEMVPFIIFSILSFFGENEEELWISYGLFVFLALISLFFLYDLLFDYVAIQGDTIISHRFFKIKKIKITDVKSVRNSSMSGLSLKDKNDKTLLRMTPNTPNLNKFFELMNERNGGRIFNINEILRIPGEPPVRNANPLDPETMTFIRLGRDYRRDFKKHLRNFTILYFSIIGGICLLPCVAMALLGESLIIVGLLAVPLLIILVFAYIKIRKNMIKELDREDVWLGEKFKYYNKHVKGAHRNQFKGIKLNCLIWLVTGCAVGGITFPIVATTKEVPYSELHTVTGYFLYYREEIGDNSYFAVGLSNLETEYRLSPIDEDEFDYSFIEEVDVGDEIILLIDDSDDRDFSMSDVEKTQWNYLYGLSANGKDYFSYEDYLKAFHDNVQEGFTIAYVFLGIAMLSATILIVSYVIYKKKEKEENIRIY